MQPLCRSCDQIRARFKTYSSSQAGQSYVVELLSTVRCRSQGDHLFFSNRTQQGYSSSHPNFERYIATTLARLTLLISLTPILGDTLHSISKPSAKITGVVDIPDDRLFLHASQISFTVGDNSFLWRTQSFL